ncbi:2-keto-4-pentenoate hydratase/2-oxohepta-3-ene-1,7-dioic acid hydratase (catechol pathway) [Nocardioides alpinus]|uniref:2-keto-4-pentenoate hydratase/2-oxohepta-3-ene-1,7-dioic acid hydratase (Catechol pathway) n=1 Tax=Nocardioides alpinus TaxID=748909 RepID=A0A1I0YBW9_9ACTN|nr:fumarylacetoacetate hydrolase family protein [Nocardioides alpinus]PKH38979.1 fumarylacetoacetate hydrolase [Nocardioides alpinus]SFB09693.1 2-keto-4-pentenoate hydratase/2-oxohepta-3-ene-1,7-dioic acid hydratase (catechol pathway) [Nocardioides alpinus]
MQLANVDGHAVLITTVTGTGVIHGIDVAEASAGKFGPGLPALYEDWDGFHAWADTLDTTDQQPVLVTRDQLGSPSPAPRQIVAIGLNYRSHAAESGFEPPTGLPPTFTKFVTSLTGPDTEIVLPPGGKTDWEVELVVVIGRSASGVDEADAWGHVAGLTIGQDISERVTQLAGPAPQFSIGKSFPGFAPVGPWLVTVDAVPDRDDLALGCAVNGETVQDGRTSDLIQSVPALIASLSTTITLLPGDLIFTGTPAGVGAGRTPPRFLQDGDQLHSWIEGLGEQRQRFVAAPPAQTPGA